MRIRQGFTLVELMIVVAMIGVLSALGIAGYRKYIHTVASGEAKGMIQMIRGAQEAYKAEMLQYLNVSSTLTAYYPNPMPDDTRWAWVRPQDSAYTSGWALLNVAPDGPVRFGYACIAGIAPAKMADFSDNFTTKPDAPSAKLPDGMPWYQIQATNRHVSTGPWVMFGATSLSGEIFVSNEQE